MDSFYLFQKKCSINDNLGFGYSASDRDHILLKNAFQCYFNITNMALKMTDAKNHKNSRISKIYLF